MKILLSKHKFLFISLICIFSAFTISCSLAKGKEQGERAVEQFHKQFNESRDREIYQQGDEKFREAVSEAEFSEFLSAVRRKLGTVQNATQTGWHVNATTMRTIATLNYETQFSDGKGNEQFSFLISGEQAKLLRYDINSPLLITR